MKTKKLYACGTTITAECDTAKHSALKFYTTIAALKEDRKCWKDCGIVEIDVPETLNFIVKENIQGR